MCDEGTMEEEEELPTISPFTFDLVRFVLKICAGQSVSACLPLSSHPVGHTWSFFFHIFAVCLDSGSGLCPLSHSC